MAVSPLQRDVGLTGPALNVAAPSMCRIEPEAPRFQPAVSEVPLRKGTGEGGGVLSIEPRDLPRQEFLSEPCVWWDTRTRQTTVLQPELKRTISTVALWLKPPWVHSQLAECDPRVKTPPESGPISVFRQEPFAAHEGNSEVDSLREICDDGRIADAVDGINLLAQRGCYVHNNLFYRVLKRCIADRDLVLGIRIHELTIKCGYEGCAFLATHLISLYASHRMLDEATRVFSTVSTPSPQNWATIIFAYARHGEAAEGVQMYKKMRDLSVEPDNRIYSAVLTACATAGDLVAGRQVHAHILASSRKPNLNVQTALLAMYAKCGSLEDARGVFDRLPSKDVVAWTAMIAGYAQQGMGEEALWLYSCMQREGLSPPNFVTFVCLLQACASVGGRALHEGKLLHAQIEERGLQDDVVLGGSLVNMYAKCGSLDLARRIFDELPDKNTVAWNAMLAGYAQQGMVEKALTLYCNMRQEGLALPNHVTFVCLLHACASSGGEEALREGKKLHAQIEEQGLEVDVALGSSLINMYTKCGCLEEARLIFDKIPEKNMLTWNAMLSGYALQGQGEEALQLYRGMQQEGLGPPDTCTFVCLLLACAVVAGLPLGKQLHAEIEQQKLQGDVVVGAALVNMYAKCGSMIDSQQVFDLLPERTIAAWGALIGGYSRQGDSEVVFRLLHLMGREGVEPDSITFLSVLTVCSHVGLVDKGREVFEAMQTASSIRPSIEHYICMVDLLGRAGHLNEALEMAKGLPFSPDAGVWHTLLGGCRKWRNVEIGKQAFELAVSFDEKDAASYVLMANIYSRAEMWNEAKEIQARRLAFKAWKQPGQSWWTDTAGVVHTFGVGDKKHPESEDIYARLENLLPRIKKEGYMPQLHSSLWDIPDDEKEAELCGHSEKLAIAYALNKTPDGTTIRVAKNLRVCEDCHAATAYISKVEKRTIICRDASRFHVYKEGKCSCGDYW